MDEMYEMDMANLLNLEEYVVIAVDTSIDDHVVHDDKRDYCDKSLAPEWSLDFGDWNTTRLHRIFRPVLRIIPRIKDSSKKST